MEHAREAVPGGRGTMSRPFKRPPVPISRKRTELRRREAERVLDTIVDPCSAASGVPIGLVDMGIIEELAIEGSSVRVRLAPTFAGCLFVGIFEAEIEQRLRELDWCEAVTVKVIDREDVWTEDHMRPSARARLERHRSRVRAEIGREHRAPAASRRVGRS